MASQASAGSPWRRSFGEARSGFSDFAVGKCAGRSRSYIRGAACSRRRRANSSRCSTRAGGKAGELRTAEFARQELELLLQGAPGEPDAMAAERWYSSTAFLAEHRFRRDQVPALLGIWLGSR